MVAVEHDRTKAHDATGQDRTGLDRTGPDRTGLDSRTGSDAVGCLVLSALVTVTSSAPVARPVWLLALACGTS